MNYVIVIISETKNITKMILSVYKYFVNLSILSLNEFYGISLL